VSSSAAEILLNAFIEKTCTDDVVKS